MRVNIIVLLVLVSFCGLSHQQLQDPTGDFIVHTLRSFLKRVLNEKISLVERDNISLSSNYTDGTFNYTGLYLYGLDGLNIDDPNWLTIDGTTTSTITLCNNASIPKEIGLGLEYYVLDLDAFEIVPLYGEGQIFFSLHSLKLDLYANLSNSYKNFSIEYLEIRPTLSKVNFTITGFWKNPEFSPLLSTTITTLADVIVIFWQLEQELMSCVLSGSAEYLINKLAFNQTYEEEIFTYVKNRCQDKAALSSYPFVRTFFKSDSADIKQYLLNLISENMA